MNRLNLAKYTNKDKVKREIQDTIMVYSDLSPRMELYTFNDGVQRNLATLCGTIKVFYVNSTYNIPIYIYLTEAHPYRSPLVFVKPTSTMSIKQSKSVDLTGQVFLPYLNEWNANSSELQTLLYLLQVEFGENMPVFAKPSGPMTFSAPNQNQYYPGGCPSYPIQNCHGGGIGWINPPTNQYPATATPYVAGAVNSNPYHPPVTTNVNNYTRNRKDSTNLLNDDVLKMSIMSAVEGKVRRVHKEIFAQRLAEVEVLEVTNKELNRGTHTIQRMLNDIDQEKINIVQIKKQLQEENETLMKIAVTREKENKAGIKYDDVVECRAPLYRQLFHLYVEEQSIEDVFYFLGEAIGKAVIETDTFLKKVRELSRRQFMLRATIKKCREKAGLPDV